MRLDIESIYVVIQSFFSKEADNFQKPSMFRLFAQLVSRFCVFD